MQELSKIHEIFPNLKLLNTPKNALANIDDVLKIHTLMGCIAYSNKISRLPETGWEAIGMQLKNLYLSDNLLEIIPDISKLVMILTLDLSSNRIRIIKGLPLNPTGILDYCHNILLNDNRLF